MKFLDLMQFSEANTVVVMSPVAAATVKHFLVPHAGPVY